MSLPIGDAQEEVLGTVFGKYSFYYSALKAWNDIHVEMRELPTSNPLFFVRTILEERQPEI